MLLASSDIEAFEKTSVETFKLRIVVALAGYKLKTLTKQLFVVSRAINRNVQTGSEKTGTKKVKIFIVQKPKYTRRDICLGS